MLVFDVGNSSVGQDSYGADNNHKGQYGAKLYGEFDQRVRGAADHEKKGHND